MYRAYVGEFYFEEPWKSKKHVVISRSSVKLKYRVVIYLACELVCYDRAEFCVQDFDEDIL